MKKIDIEKLERKNIYSVPENFFEKMQQNVLESVSEEPQLEVKKGKVIPLFWKYAAAAMVILGGWGIFMMNDQDSTSITKTGFAQNVDSSYSKQIIEKENPIQQDASTLATNEVDNSESTVITNSNESSASIKTVAHVSAKPTVNKPIAKSKKAMVSFDDQANALVASYSSAEIAKLSTEAEHDVYLDVFY